MTRKTGAALALGALLLTTAAHAAPNKLMVLSVDGLDWRYLRDRDNLGLKIPNLRKLLARSQVADGVTGVWPTITWPSHTTMITGVNPYQHGILGNASGPPDPALSYWSATKIKSPTLIQCLAGQGLTSGAVNWPVTVDTKLTWNLPEVYAERSGDSSDMDTVDRFGTPGLVVEIGKAYPSFNQQWLDDRSRTLATIYLLKNKKPDLMLLHLAELDSEQHEQGPYSTHAKAVLERSDELIGDILAAMPKDYRLALVSDHGFERIDRLVNPKALAADAKIAGAMTVAGGLVTGSDATVIAWLRAASGKGDIGREVPAEELARYTGLSGVTGFEPPDHVQFTGTGPAHDTGKTKGNHGFWPTRPDYHSIFALSGAGLKPAAMNNIAMTSINGRLEQAMGVSCPK